MKTTLPILTYHNIKEPPVLHSGLYVSPDNFERQMSCLDKWGFQTITFEQALNFILNDEKVPPKTVLVTFDDGFLDNYRNAFPVLKKYGQTATVFPVLKYLGQPAGWVQKEGMVAEPLMDWSQIKEMAEAGISFGSHGYSHLDLAGLAGSKLKEELEKPKKILEEKLGISVTGLCYPYGNYNRQVIETARKLGYRGALTVDKGNRHGREHIFELRRVFMWNDLSSLKLRYRLSALYTWEQDFKETRNRWIKSLGIAQSLNRLDGQD